MHIVVDENMSISESHKLCHKLQNQIKKIYDPCEVDIHFDPYKKK